MTSLSERSGSQSKTEYTLGITLRRYEKARTVDPLDAIDQLRSDLRGNKKISAEEKLRIVSGMVRNELRGLTDPKSELAVGLRHLSDVLSHDQAKYRRGARKAPKAASNRRR